MKLLKFVAPLLMSLGLAAFTPASALADSFTWSFASQDISGSGTLNASMTGNPGQYRITDGTGSVTDSTYGTFAVSFLACPPTRTTCTLVNSDGNGANLEYDNLLYPGNASGAQLDDYGIVLTPGPSGSGATGIGVYDRPSQVFYSYQGHGYQNLTIPFHVSAATTPVAATPEPASLALVCSGVLGVACRLRRRNRS